MAGCDYGEEDASYAIQANKSVNKTKQIQKEIMHPTWTDCSLGAGTWRSLGTFFDFAVTWAFAHGSFPGWPFFEVAFFGVARFDLLTSARSAQSGAPPSRAIPAFSAHAQSLGARRRRRLLRLRAPRD